MLILVLFVLPLLFTYLYFHIIKVRQGANGNFVPGLTEIPVSTEEEINDYIHIANQRRSQAATDCNLHSSRSHLIMQVSCVSYDNVSKVTSHGKLHLIDLAGSERIKQSQVREHIINSKHK